MISTLDRRNAALLISAATAAPARQFMACAEMEISERGLRRWTAGGPVREDQRPLVARPVPLDKLSEAERQAGR